MEPYTNPVNSTRRKRPWFRRYHRWLGGVAAFFVLLLALSGIALNHGHAWKLDRSHVSWNWLLGYYSIEAPGPTASFAAGGHRATLLGGKLYFDLVELGGEADALYGLVRQGEIYVLATQRSVTLATGNGQLVDRIDLGATLPGPVRRLGLKDGLAVLQVGDRYIVADAELTGFAPAEYATGAEIDWSTPSQPPEQLLSGLQSLYLARALTVERVLADLHSGRILGPSGVWFMDFIALSLIVLSVTGLFQWRRRNGRR